MAAVNGEISVTDSLVASGGAVRDETVASGSVVASKVMEGGHSPNDMHGEKAASKMSEGVVVEMLEASNKGETLKVVASDPVWKVN